MLDFEFADPSAIGDFLSEDGGYGFNISIPLRWTCSEKALSAQGIPFLPGIAANDKAAYAISIPQKMMITTERLAELYRVANFHTSFTFTFNRPDDAGEMFDAIFYFLVHFNNQQRTTGRRPSGEVTEKILALDLLAKLIWRSVGWERIVLEGWRWDQKLRLGEFDEKENLSSLVTLGMAPRLGAQADTSTDNTSDDEALAYRSPVEGFITKVKGTANSNIGPRQRKVFGGDGNDNGTTGVDNIPEWMLKGIS